MTRHHNSPYSVSLEVHSLYISKGNLIGLFSTGNEKQVVRKSATNVKCFRT